jgi:hypothetical protein
VGQATFARMTIVPLTFVLVPICSIIIGVRKFAPETFVQLIFVRMTFDIMKFFSATFILLTFVLMTFLKATSVLMKHLPD